MFNEWLKLVKAIADKSPNTDNLTCPKCGDRGIDFQYVGDETTRVGYLDIWCKSCLHGIHISRTKVPASANLISFDEPAEVVSSRIPNFIQITPIDK
ncbi:hypothetical protein [Clostridium sp. JS66]|uniref:hypothetical protein n=1 Tax=Clostridium sp. JS66 TaxID=3064705 RepID=UPI00298D7E94|nr:hypothetical protein [Clostridium sp. JS66]WPC42726.1 hypothetical protein Q6H37_04430 [Clostridium sp. JS66]